MATAVRKMATAVRTMTTAVRRMTAAAPELPQSVRATAARKGYRSPYATAVRKGYARRLPLSVGPICEALWVATICRIEL